MTEDLQNNAKLYKKKLAVMNAVRSVAKDGRNTHQNFDFVSREEVYSKIRSAMVENNLAVDGSIVSVSDSDKEGSRIITFEFFLIDAETGHSVSRLWSQPGYEMAKGKQGMYVDPYGFAKAETYAMKQWLMTTFLLTSKEDAEIEQDSVRNSGEIINLFHGETFIEVAQNATGLEREQIQTHLRNEFAGQPKDPIAWLKSLVDYKAQLALEVAGVSESELEQSLEDAATSGLNGNKVIAPDFNHAPEEPAAQEQVSEPEPEQVKTWDQMTPDEKKLRAEKFVNRLAEENNREPDQIRSILKNSGMSYNPDNEEQLSEYVANAVSVDEKSTDAGFAGSARLNKNVQYPKDEIAAVEDIEEGDDPFSIPGDDNDLFDTDIASYGLDDESELDGDVKNELDELDELSELGNFVDL